MKGGVAKIGGARLPSGFTLVELLVAAGVFSLLMLGLAVVLASTQKMAKQGTSRIEADAEVRTLKSLLERDLQRRLIGDGGLPLKVEVEQPEAGEEREGDVLGFLTMAPGYEGDRDLSWVEYRIKDARLQRGSRGFRFGSAEERDPTGDLLHTTMEGVTLEEGDYQVVSDRIFRLEIDAIEGDGAGGDQTWAGPVSAVANVSLFVSIAVIGDAAMSLLDEQGRVALGELFVAVDPGTQAIPKWREALDGAIAAGGNGVPLPVLQSVRFYQTVVALH